MPPTADRPPLAAQKYVDDWKEQPVRLQPPDLRSWSLGPEKGRPAAADLILFGDYQEPFCAEMDRAIRDFLRSHPDVRYTFRHYPIDPSINPALPPKVRPEALHPLAGRAAKAAEAAGSLGGAAAYWKMHDWLMSHQKEFGDETLLAAARGMGLDPDALVKEMDKPEVASAIAEDCRAGQTVGLRGVPMVIIDGRWVPRTNLGDENVVIRILTDLTTRGDRSSR
jgi:protein-disulfide isomerase